MESAVAEFQSNPATLILKFRYNSSLKPPVQGSIEAGSACRIVSYGDGAIVPVLYSPSCVRLKLCAIGHPTLFSIFVASVAISADDTRRVCSIGGRLPPGSPFDLRPVG